MKKFLYFVLMSMQNVENSTYIDGIDISTQNVEISSFVCFMLLQGVFFLAKQ